MQNCLSLQNLRFSSLFAAEDVSSSAAKSEEKLMFSQARITFTMTTLNTAFTSGRRAQNASSEWNGQKRNIIVNLWQMYATG